MFICKICLRGIRGDTDLDWVYEQGCSKGRCEYCKDHQLCFDYQGVSSVDKQCIETAIKLKHLKHNEMLYPAYKPIHYGKSFFGGGLIELLDDTSSTFIEEDELDLRTCFRLNPKLIERRN